MFSVKKISFFLIIILFSLLVWGDKEKKIEETGGKMERTELELGEIFSMAAAFGKKVHFFLDNLRPSTQISVCIKYALRLCVR